MGVYFKDMDKPGSCDECPRYCCPHNFDDCPAIAVPAHGRLIDADKLCLSSGFSTATEYGQGRSDQIEAIKSNAPTVIPAEEGS